MVLCTIVRLGRVDGAREVISYYNPDHATILSGKSQSKTRFPNASHVRIFPNGASYNVFQFILFPDDFQVSSYLSRPRRVGGLRLAPTCLPAHERNTTSSIYVVSLTHPNMSTMEVINFVLGDIDRGAMTGVEMQVTPWNCRILMRLPLGSWRSRHYCAWEGMR